MIAYADYFTDARIKNYVEALLKDGYEVDVFALGRPETTRPGLRVFCLMPKVVSRHVSAYVFSQLWFLVVAAFRVGLAHLRRRYRVVHIHNLPDFIVFAALIPKLFGAKLILDIHDTMPEAFATKFAKPLDHPIIRAIRCEERVSAAFVDHVITTNDLHKEALISHGLPAGKISIVMNLGNQAIFHPRPSRERQDALTLAYHGTVAARLGPDLILDAIRRVRRDCPGLRFVLIGDGDFMPTVKELILNYGLQDIVKVEGWVPVEHLPELLARADVGVVGNRRYTEEYHNWMLPVKMLEYAAMEIPTIAPRLRIIRRYFDEASAILYEPDNVDDLARCMREVYEHQDRLDAVRKGLRAFNARHNWRSMEQRYLQLITDLIATR
ncbi:MAG: glycosyltransferase family 4 protein [candidate division KSB1 bacterium]|nr:glycosyltransferase family 4 protein [candidate division KSB1 bacterium]